MHSGIKSFVQLLEERTAHDPGKIAFKFECTNLEGPKEETFEYLLSEVNKVAGFLRHHSTPEKPVILYTDSLPDLIHYFFGCLKAGRLAVPAYSSANRKGIARLEHMVKDCGASMVLTSERLRARCRGLGNLPSSFDLGSWISGDEINASGYQEDGVRGKNSVRGNGRHARAANSNIAYLQYSSGSVHAPKGIQITHDNLLMNSAFIQRKFGTSPDSVGLSWLPLYHDMGLIGGILQPIFAGYTGMLMPTADFIRSPLRWLELITQNGVTVSGGPDFAYDLCVQKVHLLVPGSIDLHSWTVAYNGSEPVRKRTLDQFAAAFGSYGFRQTSFYPCYGLAESTLFVSGGRYEPVPEEVSSFLGMKEPVCVGGTEDSGKIRIVSPDSKTGLEEGCVGEIWVSGTSVAAGYAGKPAETEAAFKGVLSGEGEEPFLRTGDMGLIYRGQLFVLGRLKDMIIIRGNNYYPEDFELSLNGLHPLFEHGRAVAFAIPDEAGNEGVVIVQEINKRIVDNEMITSIEQMVMEKLSRDFEVRVMKVLLVPPGTLPRTINGKLRRSECKKLYLEGSLPVIGQPASPEEEIFQADASQTGTADTASDTLQSLKDWLRWYGENRINSRLIHERRCIPPYIILDFARKGLLGLFTPQRLGGIGLSWKETFQVLEQLAAIDLTIASFVGVHNALGITPLLRFGTPAQQGKWLQEMAQGRCLGAFALTEPGAGSNLHHIAATATPVKDGGWLLQGRKSWVGNGSWANVITVFARVSKGPDNMSSMGSFVIEPSMKGVKNGPEALTMGMHGMVQNSIILEDVEVSSGHLLGREDQGLDIANAAIDTGRIGLCAMSVGCMKRAAQLLLRYTGRRVVATGLLINNAVIQEKLSHVLSSIDALEALLDHLSTMLDTGKDIPREVSGLAKVIGTELCFQTADSLMQYTGGRGYIETNEIPQLFQDARLLRIFEGPTEPLLIHFGSSIMRRPESFKAFLTGPMRAADVWKRLEEKIVQLNLATGRQEPVALLTGWLAAYSVLEAALGYRSPVNFSAIAWAQLNMENLFQQFHAGQKHTQVYSVEKMTAIVERYTMAIGNIEQQLPGADHILDPLLKREGAAAMASGGVAPVASGGAIPGERAVVEAGPAASEEKIGAEGQVILKWLTKWVAAYFGLQPEKVDPSLPLNSYGMDSLSAIELAEQLKKETDINLNEEALFNFPTILALTRFIASTHAKEVQRFMRLSAGPLRESNSDRYSPFPLTDIQRAYLAGRDPSLGMGAGGCQFYWEFECATPDIERLTKAWNKLVAHHENLRTRISLEGTQQIMQEAPYYTFPVTDLRGVSPATRDQRLLTLREKASQQSFQPYEWPLFFVHALFIEANKARLQIGIDLLIVDGGGMFELFRQWSRFYSDPGYDPALPEWSYRDHVLQSIDRKKTEKYKQAEAYWVERAPSLPAAPSLPVVQRTLGGVLRFERQTHYLPADVWRSLKERCREYDLTPSAMLIGIFSEVVSYWSGSKRFTINLTLSHTPLQELKEEGILGNYTTTLLLAVDQKGGTVLSRLTDLQAQLRKDLVHYQFGGIGVLRAINRSSEQVMPVLMPVVFTSALDARVKNAVNPTAWLGKEIYSITRTPQVTLDCQVFELEEELRINWDFTPEAYPDGLIMEMFGAYRSLLDELAAGRVWEAKLPELVKPGIAAGGERLGADEGMEITDQLLHTLFLESADRYAHHVAMVSGGQSYKYSELLQLSYGLAAEVAERHLPPLSPIVILQKRGMPAMLSVLATLMAGHVYVPIPYNTPLKRLSGMAATVNAALVITDAAIAADLQGLDLPPVLIVEEHMRVQDSQAGPLPVRSPSSTHLAYIMHTSGSTGFPKGVMIDHRGPVNTIRDINRRFNLQPADCILNISSLSFDLSVYDLFGALGAGARLVIPTEEEFLHVEKWLDLIHKNQVTVWNSVPALMEKLICYIEDRPVAHLFASVRLILLSGDWIPVNLPARIRAQNPHVVVISLGGATEASIWSIYYPIPKIVDKIIPYGKALANQTCYVYNADLQPCPVWVRGDFYIGGIGLARGYWNDPEQTKRLFFNHPVTGERIYRTGDLARYLPDGNIELLGRDDEQVKVNGYRIELGEIENTIRQHPGVRNNLARVWGEPNKGKKLLSYIIPDPEYVPVSIGRTAGLTFNAAFGKDIRSLGQQYMAHIPEEMRKFTAGLKLLDQTATSYIYNVFHQLGLFQSPGEQCSLEELTNAAGVLPKYKKLFLRWLSILEEDGLITTSNGHYTTIRRVPGSPQADTALPADIPDELMSYVIRSGTHLLALIRGDEDPLQFFFPGGKTSVTAQLYRLNPVSIYYNALIGRFFELIIRHWPSDQPLRVLEVGAGTGGTTNSVLPLLKEANARYYFTDISYFFLDQAKQNFRDHPFVSYGLLDINKSAVGQGWLPYHFDIILAANVLHDAVDLGYALGNLQKLLTPDGLGVIWEVTENTRLQGITIGFIEGFSSYEDARAATNAPLQSAEQWTSVFESTRFRTVGTFPEPPDTLHQEGQHLFLIQSAAIDGPGLWQGEEQPGKEILTRELHQWLQERLPPHMIPASFLYPGVFPLSANGKIARDQLPLPGVEDTHAEKAADLSLATDLEKEIAGIWAELLHKGQVSVKDNFFELGGDSLLAIRHCEQVRSKLGFETNATDIFQYPTVQRFANYLMQLDNIPPAIDEANLQRIAMRKKHMKQKRKV